MPQTNDGNCLHTRLAIATNCKSMPSLLGGTQFEVPRQGVGSYICLLINTNSTGTHNLVLNMVDQHKMQYQLNYYVFHHLVYHTVHEIMQYIQYMKYRLGPVAICRSMPFRIYWNLPYVSIHTCVQTEMVSTYIHTASFICALPVNTCMNKLTHKYNNQHVFARMYTARTENVKID